ncbi:hypothetical protein [Pseudomonas prosekii]|uniref:hypothetical protein n=1 Tax=Pseudomonas prosekii TaxID=1148509 RepID=UPI0028DE6DD5|nr:hypothetical protein [Pseudomonas prosekii]MDT8906686.1 hypothetical protein [Pseudomonas prosekii]
MTTQPQASVRDMKRCNWAFLVKGPYSSLECLPSVSPWWSIAFSTDRSEWEAFIPDHQHEADSNRQFDLAMQAITRMNGLAVSSGQPGLIEMTHHVDYDHENNRDVAIPLRLVFKVNILGGFGPTEPAAVDFSRILPENLPRLAILLDYWGQPNAESYEGLYKIMEFIQSVDAKILKSVSENTLGLLKRTCNNICSGLSARHADVRVPPVPKPMPLSKIREIVRDFTELYIRSITLPEHPSNEPAPKQSDALVK